MTALKFNKVKNLPTSGYNVGDVFFVSSEKKIYIRTASGWEKYDGGFTTVISGKVDKTLNAKSLEAITIKTGNTPDDKAANVAAIKAYVDNLTALGVDVTKGVFIPVNAENICGVIRSNTNGTYPYVGFISDASNVSNCYNFMILSTGETIKNQILFQLSQSLTTTSKQIIGAINEVNTLAKGKQDKLTSGTNIKTVNGQSLLGSGDIAISGGGDVTAAGDNTFTGNNVFNGIAIADILGGTQYQITGDNGSLMFAEGATNEDIQLTGVATPTFSNSAANKKYVDDKVAAAGGGSAPTIIDLDEIPDTPGKELTPDTFNILANAAINMKPIFGYTNSSISSVSNYEIIPLTVRYLSGATVARVMIDLILFNKHYIINLAKNADNTYTVVNRNTHSLATDTSVSNSSANGVQSSAVWKEIHAEPMTVNTATSGVTILSSTDKHKILCYAASGTQQYNLPASPVDGETFLFLKVKSGHAITIQSGTGNQNIYDCSSGNSVVSKTIATSTRRKITVTYSSTVGKWFLMADDFLS